MFKCPSFRKIGVVCLSVLTFELVYAIIKFGVIKPYRRSKIVLKKLGKWAVVTTNVNDCLGKEYAYALAKEGLCIVLIGKDIHKLECFAAELEAKFRVGTLLLEANLAALGAQPEQLLQLLERPLQLLEVGVLVNCLSVTSPHPEYFAALPHRDRIYAAILGCNVVAATLLTRVVLEGMARRRRGLVLLVSSTAALLPCPLLTVYAASQAYVQKFAQDLALECAPLGVVVETHTPGYIAERPSGTAPGAPHSRSLRPSSWSAPSPSCYVSASLAALGSDTSTPAYVPHSILVSLARLLLWAAPDATARAILRGMEILRAQALQRYRV